MFSWMPGADLDSVAEREIADLNSTRQGSKDRVGAWNWQDDVGAWLANTNKAGVLQRAKEIQDARLKEIYDSKFKVIKSELGDLAPKYKGVDGVSQIDLDNQINIDRGRAQALADLQATNPNVDISVLGPNVSAAGIKGAGIRATKQEQDKKENERLTRLYNERVANREETIRQFNNNLALRTEAQDADIRARQDTLDMNRLKLQMEQNRYMYDAQTRRQERVANLGKALTALGGAFFI